MARKIRVPVRRENISRLCRRCAKQVPELEFAAVDWICPECVENAVPAIMPLVEKADHQRYVTKEVFAGYRVIKARQGPGREQYAQEVPSRAGEFYPCAEAAMALYTKTAHTANRLAAEFPEVRIFTRGEDGRCVVHFPVKLFPLIAKKCGAFRSRAGKDPTPAQVEARQQSAERLRKLAESKVEQLSLL